MSLKPVEEVYFCDDGTGYDYIYTVLHHSNKKIGRHRRENLERIENDLCYLSAA